MCGVRGICRIGDGVPVRSLVVGIGNALTSRAVHESGKPREFLAASVSHCGAELIVEIREK